MISDMLTYRYHISLPYIELATSYEAKLSCMHVIAYKYWMQGERSGSIANR